MKRYILQALKRMGYAVAHIEVFNDLAQSASELHGAKGRIEDLEQQLARERESFRAQKVTLKAQLMETKAQLARCARERELSAKHMARLDLRIQALKRRRDFFGAEMHKVQDQLASVDVSGRIRDLEDEKVSLKQRLGDLEVFFAERQNVPHSKLSA